MNHSTPTEKSIVSAIVRQFRRVSANGIARQGVKVFVLQVLGVAVGFACQILIARLVGEEQYGIHAYVISWLFVSVLPAVFGMDLVALRFFSSYSESKAYAKIQGLIRFSRRLVLSMSLLSLMVALAIVGILHRVGRITDVVAICFAVGLASIPIAAQLNLNIRLLWACKKPALSAALVNLLRPSLVAAMVTSSYFLLPGATTARESLFAYVLATLVIVLIGSKAIRSFCKERQPLTEPPEYERSVWLKAAMPFLLIASFHIVIEQCSIIMVGYYLGYTQAGFYSAASRMVSLAAFGLIATDAVVAPMISAAYSNNRMDDLRRSLRTAAATVFALTIPLVLVLLLLGKLGLGFFGESFKVAYPVIVILCGGQLVNALSGCVGYLMVMTGNERTSARILFCAALLNVTLNATLIPIWGIQGAACATATTRVVWNLWMLVVVWKRLRMNPTVLSWIIK